MSKVLLIEDHPVVIEGIIKVIKEISIIKQTEWISNGKQALEFIEIFNPDLILLDINLPDIDGIDLCKIITKKFKNIKIICLSSYSEKTYISEMLNNGAKGYIIKNSDAEEIKKGIVEVLEGKIFLCSEANQILSEGVDKKTNLFLTPREREVLKLISDGYTNNEIATKLFICQSTVDSHRKNLLLKLNAKNTAALIKIAYEKGLFQKK